MSGLGVQQPPIDRGWAWFVCFAYGGHKMVNNLIVRGTSIFFLEFMKTYDASVAAVSVIPALQLFLAFFLSPISNVLAVKYGVRPVVVAGGIINAAAFIISMFATSVTYLYFSYAVITGIGMSTSTGPPALTVSRYFSKKKALAFGLTGLGMGAGAMTGSVLVRHLVDQYGLKGALLIFSAIQLHGSLLGLLYRPLSFYQNRSLRNFDPSRLEDGKQSLELEICTSPATQIETQSKQTVTTHEIRDRSRSLNVQQIATTYQIELRTGEYEETSIQRNIKHYENLHTNSRQRSRSVMSVPAGRVRTTSTMSTKSKTSAGVSTLALSELSCLSVALTVQDLSQFYDDSDEDQLSEIDQQQEDAINENENTQKKILKKAFILQFIKNPMYWAIVLSSFFAVFGTTPVFTILTAYCNDMSISSDRIALIVSLSAIPDFCIRPFIGWISDKEVVPKVLIQIVSLLLASLVAFLWTQCRTFESVLAASLIAIILLCTSSTVVAPVIIDTFGLASMPFVLGTILFVQSFAFLLSPTLSGYLRDVSGDWSSVYTMSASLGIGSAATLAVIPIYQKLHKTEDP